MKQTTFQTILLQYCTLFYFTTGTGRSSRPCVRKLDKEVPDNCNIPALGLCAGSMSTLGPLDESVD